MMSVEKGLPMGIAKQETRRVAIRVAIVFACVLLLWPLTGRGQIPCGYEVKQIISAEPCQFTGSPTRGLAISDHNPPWTTGYYTPCATGTDQAFLSTGLGDFTQLLPPDMLGGYGDAITNSGLVVGSYFDLFGGHGFALDTTTNQWIEMLPAQPGGGSTARGANNKGQVVGSRDLTPAGPNNAYIYDDGVYTDLGIMNGPKSEAQDVSDSGFVVGWTGTGIGFPNCHGFIYSKDTTTVFPPIPGGVSSYALAVNNAGTAVGSGNITLPSGTPASRAFYRLLDGPMVDIGTLPGFIRSFANDISENGTIVGEARTSLDGLDAHAGFVWFKGVMVDINSLLPSSSNVIVRSANAINDDGEIVASGIQILPSFSTVAIVLSPVSSWPGDINHDCEVNVADLLMVLNQWGLVKSTADVNGDGVVNALDLAVVLSGWTAP